MTETKNQTIFFKMSDVCEHYGIGPRTFRELVRLGLPTKKIGNRWAVHREVFEQFVKEYLSSTSTSRQSTLP